MNLKNKILIILSLCLLLCLGTFFIIVRTFDNFEKQLFEKCRIEALVGARVMSDTIDMLIRHGQLTRTQVFDTNYIAIADTNPQKFHTSYDRVFDKNIQTIQDEFLEDPDVEYAVLVDRNGYVPTHNSKYSKPETDNMNKNLQQSRTKRIFNDSVGIKAARFKGEGTIKQLYYRDTGETMWDIAAAVHVRDKHWGAFRIGVSLERINEIKNQMIIIVGMTILVILSRNMVMRFLVLARKLYDSDLDVPKY